MISVVGDVTMDEIKSKLTEKLKGWVGKSEKNNSKKLFQKLESKKILYLLHKPEVQQSVVLAGYTFPPYGNISEIAKEPLINVLGGDFTSRINLNLREDKHWTYGAGAFVKESKEERAFIAVSYTHLDVYKRQLRGSWDTIYRII